MHPCTTINDNLKSFIDALGGSLDDSDINSATYTEGGKDLLAWLALQASFLNDEGPEESKQSLDDHTQVILRDVMLEKDEILFRDVDPEFVHDDDEKAPDSLNSKTYMTPSKLKRHAAFIKDENDLIERQIDVLTLRISKTKEASKALAYSIKSLQRVVHTLDTKIRSEEATITELSFHTDSIIATTISDAREAFRSLGYFPANDGQPHTEIDLSEPNSDLTSIRAFLLATRDEISNITSDVRNGLDFLSNLRKGQSEKIRDIESESSRLQAAFYALDIGDEDAVFEMELREICLLLEHEAQTSSGTGVASEVLTTLLSEADGVSSVDGWVEHRNITVQDVLHHAWVRDQMASLQTEHAILDRACTSLASVVEPLQNLRSLILPLVSIAREVEAVVEAFIEELADVALPEGDDRDLTRDSEDTELEENLRHVLIGNQGTLPGAAMTREKILAELQGTQNRARNIEPTERARTEDIIRQAAFRPLHSALPCIYVNSPLHSSPPFSFPPAIQDLEACTRKKAGELQSIADSVEEDLKNSSARDSNAKRLDAFVEKWIPK